MKTKWTRWGGGHGTINAFTLELGHLVRADIQLKAATPRIWVVRVNRVDAGEYATFDEAFANAEGRVGELCRDFLDDWVIWTIAGRNRHPNTKGMA
jgi:hypothetical protein